ncbi:hypothetical protein [Neoroseomonas lacus]|uniref:Uncharacterized protein n=1 Tax=Neoroseomonas lacus TaxID=287609 RepID=A0A917NG55_9PROT|nr:hypothetical protein [Neoroseomonas lacus]GGI97788.1 hypothetical protein GCM10011320_00660 [Neoroseomonas lacus]
MIRRSAILLTLLATAACTQPERTTLPEGLGPQGAVSRDPSVAVGQEIVDFFRTPQPNQPAAAARAIAELEWLADTLPSNPRYQTASATGLNELAQARSEARTALGIPRAASNQAVINGLAGAARAIEAGNQQALAAALPRNVFTLGPQATVQRLSQPPSVPSVMHAYWALSGGAMQRH